MNALQFQKKLLSMQENMMNFALMLTANTRLFHLRNIVHRLLL